MQLGLGAAFGERKDNFLALEISIYPGARYFRSRMQRIFGWPATPQILYMPTKKALHLQKKRQLAFMQTRGRNLFKGCITGF